MFAKTAAAVLLWALCAPALLAAPGYHDYSQYFHWSAGHIQEGDDVTSVRSCTILGSEYLATTGVQSGLGFYELQGGDLVRLGNLPLAGSERGVVVQEFYSYVAAGPDRLHKVLTFSPANPVLQWSDILPASPVGIAEFGGLLLLPCAEGGLLVHDPSEQFGMPTGVIGTWPGPAHEVHVLDHRVVVRTDDGLATLDLSDPAAPALIGEIAIQSCQALAVGEAGDRAYLAINRDVVEIDISDLAAPAVLRTLVYNGYSVALRDIMLYQGGIMAAAGNDLFWWDLVSDEQVWEGFCVAYGQDMTLFADKMVIAGGGNGVQVFENLGLEYAPSSPPFVPDIILKAPHITDGMLLGFHADYVECRDLRGDPAQPAWVWETFDQNEYCRHLDIEGGRAAVGLNNGNVRLFTFDRSGYTEVGSFPTAGEECEGIGFLPGGHLAVYVDPTDDQFRERILEIYDINDPAAPQLVSSLVNNDLPKMAVTGSTVILWDGSSSDNGAWLYDLSDPANPLLTDTTPLPYFNDLRVSGDHMYAVEPPILQAFDISYIHNIVAGPELFIPAGYGLVTSGQSGYLQGTDLVYDLSDPLVPVPVGSVNNPWTENTGTCAAGEGYLVIGTHANWTVMAEHGLPGSPAPEPLPRVTDLRLQAAPNPFNPRVEISFEMPAAGTATLLFHDVRGRRLGRQEVEVGQAGRGRLMWDGGDRDGRPLPSGVYLVEVRTEVGRDWIKVMLAR